MFSHDSWASRGKFEIIASKTLSYFYKLNSKVKQTEDKEFLEEFLNLKDKYNNKIEINLCMIVDDNNNPNNNRNNNKKFEFVYGELIQEGILNYWSLLANRDEFYMDESGIRKNIEDFCYGDAILDSNTKKDYVEQNKIRRIRRCGGSCIRACRPGFGSHDYLELWGGSW
jgi:hypothetical protein